MRGFALVEAHIEHRSLFWLLGHLKIVRPDGEPYDRDRDYVGAFPGPVPGDPPREVTDLSLEHVEGIDLLYLADTYGVYEKDLESGAAMKAALEPSFDRVLLRQPAPVTVEVDLLSFQLLQAGTKKPATCSLTIQVEVRDAQGRRLEKGTFSSSASGAFDGRSNPEAVWRVSYDVADQFKNWLAGSPAVANAVERSRYATAVAEPRAVSPSPSPRQPVASKRYKPGYSRKVAAVIGINDYGV